MGTTRDTLKRRVRKTVKWGGAVLTVLLVVVWIASRWFALVWISPSGSVAAVSSGELKHVAHQEALVMAGPGWHSVRVPDPSLRSEFYWASWKPVPSFTIPLWCPALVSLLVTLAAWWPQMNSRRRLRRGRCPTCGCHRAGLRARAVCPECGTMTIP